MDRIRSSKELAEDYGDGLDHKGTTSGMIIVTRDMGTIYNVSVSGFKIFVFFSIFYCWILEEFSLGIIVCANKIIFFTLKI